MQGKTQQTRRKINQGRMKCSYCTNIFQTLFRRMKHKTISPPLKLKIKFGKDKTGAITHGKIKSKNCDSSTDGEGEGGGRRKEQELPPDPDTPFHGFPASCLEDWEGRLPGQFEGWDLAAPFRSQSRVNHVCRPLKSLWTRGFRVGLPVLRISCEPKAHHRNSVRQSVVRCG